MFPYADNLSGWYRAPVVGTLIIMFLVITAVDHAFSAHDFLLKRFGFIPLLFSIQPWKYSYTLVTASFIHADTFHVAGNCLFLWVFGRSLERLFGWWRFAVLFPFLGAAGFLTQWLLNPASATSVLGASGAIASLLGAYLVLFPSARMRAVVVWLPLWKRIIVPAWAFVGFWIALQLISLVAGNTDVDGIAYAVHVGSFCSGLLGAAVWKTSAPMAEERLVEFISSSFSPTR